jgi:hypothetical protein
MIEWCWLNILASRYCDKNISLRPKKNTPKDNIIQAQTPRLRVRCFTAFNFISKHYFFLRQRFYLFLRY